MLFSLCLYRHHYLDDHNYAPSQPRKSLSHHLSLKINFFEFFIRFSMLIMKTEGLHGMSPYQWTVCIERAMLISMVFDASDQQDKPVITVKSSF